MAIIDLARVDVFAEGLDHSEGIAQLPDGDVYVGGEAGQIYRISPGTAEQIVTVPSGGLLLGLAATEDGCLLVCDTKARAVWRVNVESRQCSLYSDRVDDGEYLLPNWGCFLPDGSFIVSDSGEWKSADGRVVRIPPGGGRATVWAECRNFPNGMALSEDGASVWVLESTPGYLLRVPLRGDGTAGTAQRVCQIPGVPDGVAVAADGRLVISCYRPDTIYIWDSKSGLSVLVEDPEGTVLAAPTNVLFLEPGRIDLVWPNLGRWHASVLRDCGLIGVPVLRR